MYLFIHVLIFNIQYSISIELNYQIEKFLLNSNRKHYDFNIILDSYKIAQTIYLSA